MGNFMVHCFTPGTKTVRVYRDKGRISEFYSPVPASKLMEEHPNHLLVYRSVKTVFAKEPKTPDQDCSAGQPASKQLVNVRVVQFSDTLEVGRVYFLVKIPEKYMARFAKYFNLGPPKCEPRTQSSAARDSQASAAISTGGVPKTSVVMNEELFRWQLRAYSRKIQSQKSTRRASKAGGKPGSRPCPGGMRSRPRSPSNQINSFNLGQGRKLSCTLRMKNSSSTSDGSGIQCVERRLVSEMPAPPAVQWRVLPRSRGFTGMRFRRYSRKHWKPVLESISEVADIHFT